MWFDHHDLPDIVVRVWSFISHANASTCLAVKLRMTRRALTMWSKSKFENVNWKKLHLLKALNKLDILLESRPLSLEKSSLKVSSLDELDKIQLLE